MDNKTLKKLTKYIKSGDKDMVAKYLDNNNSYGINELLVIAGKFDKEEIVYLLLDSGCDDYLRLLYAGVKHGNFNIVEIGLKFCEYSWLNNYDVKSKLYMEIYKGTGNNFYKIGKLLDAYYHNNYTEED